MTRRDWLWFVLAVCLALAGLSERQRVEEGWLKLYLHADERAHRYNIEAYYWRTQYEARASR